ncbi:hypothetical protein A2Z33_00895 [Candidatus Gottesmanbacteria bacterium RBG_16_52_11]|uniref:Glycosyltransferase RgtA/B/C/D-like domain-containing protein n=1 Tax=Candidatus Gottesmanbacteria bacterium RBG_16_52_11 TaxID=1798374 RepID=A0A1F5YNS5_9BACT|nr:MAG: hypothetical protein A2Z33_00895 [Candidatus Gottesmanbacteria bacterium RBG_16_52_11]
MIKHGAVRILRVTGPAALLTVGIALRFINLNWDGGTGLIHSDERLITDATLRISFSDNLNPGFQDYNGLPVYTLKGASVIASSLTGNPGLKNSVSGITLTGRLVSAILSAFTVLIIYLIGKGISPDIGITAAILAAFSPIALQLAHFHTTDTYLTFFAALLFLFLIRGTGKPGLGVTVTTAVISGLAIGVKNTAYLLLPLPAAFTLYSGRIAQRIVRITVFGLVAIAVFFIVSPYTFLNFGEYASTYRYLTRMAIGREIYGWTLQFKNSGPLMIISNLLFAYGPVMMIAGTAGLVKLGWPLLRTRLKPVQAASAWTVAFTLFLAFAYVKFIRYVLPVMPMLSVGAAIVISKLSKHRAGRYAGYAAIISTIAWGLSFSAVYLKPNPLVSASGYIYKNIPAGSSVCTERNNTAIPLPQGGSTPDVYRQPSFDFYAPDSPAKSTGLTRWLGSCDYFVITSRRVYGTVLNLPETFPETGKFYRSLLSGSAGFVRIAEFESYPKLGPLIINDDASEETFAVFDHPKVMIFRRNF